jgi:hypothetical protein
MTTTEDLESYFIRMGVEADELEEGMWVIPSSDGGTQVVVRSEPPLLLLRLKVMDLPTDMDDIKLAPFYRRLLELNATDIVYGSYGIEAEEVILSHALELDTLDFQELRSSYESLTLAASSHVAGLAKLIPVAHEG